MAGPFAWLTSRLVSRQSRQTRHFHPLGSINRKTGSSKSLPSRSKVFFFFFQKKIPNAQKGKKKKAVKSKDESYLHTSYGAFGER